MVLVFLLLLLAASWLVWKLGAKMWTWRPPFGRWTVTASFILVPAFMFYACLSALGVGYSLSPQEAQADLSSHLGVPVPPVVAVSDPEESWAIGDYYYNYTVSFEPTSYRQLIERWEARRDTTKWSMNTNPYVTDSLHEKWTFIESGAPGGTIILDVDLFPSTNKLRFSYGQD